MFKFKTSSEFGASCRRKPARLNRASSGRVELRSMHFSASDVLWTPGIEALMNFAVESPSCNRACCSGMRPNCHPALASPASSKPMFKNTSTLTPEVSKPNKLWTPNLNSTNPHSPRPHAGLALRCMRRSIDPGTRLTGVPAINSFKDKP